MNTIKFEDDKIITTKDGVKEIWNLKNIESSQYIIYNGKRWFLKEEKKEFDTTE
jgi:hypothetical protein